MIKFLAVGFLTLLAGAAAAEPAAWRIPGTGDGTVMLLGSVHTLRESDYPLPPLINTLYDEAESLVMELDLDDLDPASIQSALLAAAMLPAEERLADVLDSALYAQADAQAENLGIDLELLDRFEPWLVAVTMLDLGMMQMGYRPERGLEQYLLNRARADGKGVEGLESLETQVRVFDELPLIEQAALLEQTLNELGTAQSVMDNMVSAWRDGQLDVLAEDLTEDFAAFPELYDALVVDRNTAWIEEIERLLGDGQRYLIVVGGLHLVGQDSVISMLIERGHTVERIH